MFVASSTKFNKKPDDIVNATLGDDLVLEWNYTQRNQEAELLTFYKFSISNKKIELAYRDLHDGTGFRFTNQSARMFGARIEALSENTSSTTIVIKNITYNDSGYYMMKVKVHQYNDLFHKILVNVNVKLKKKEKGRHGFGKAKTLSVLYLLLLLMIQPVKISPNKIMTFRYI